MSSGAPVSGTMVLLARVEMTFSPVVVTAGW